MTVSGYSIRPATDGSGTQIAALIAGVFSDYENCPFIEAEFAELAAVSSHYKGLGGDIWIATNSDGNIVGCFAIVPTAPKALKSPKAGARTFEIFKVYVAETARGTGLAQALYNTGLLWGQERGLQKLRLWTDTRFLSGHRFYEKLGFTKQPVIRYLGDAAESWEYLYVCNNPTLATKALLDQRDS